MMTIEQMARELAELRVQIPCPDGKRGCLAAHFAFDPRFDALRGEHDLELQTIGHGSNAHICKVCHQGQEEWSYRPELQPYCLRHDLVSIVRAAVACGFEAFRLNHLGDEDEHPVWAAYWQDSPGEPDGFGETPEEAAMNALYDAVKAPR